MKDLTHRQQEILRFLHKYFQETTSWPSIREIQNHFSFKSTNAVIGHLQALEKKAYLEKVSGRARSFRLNLEKISEWCLPRTIPLVNVPVYGAIAAGYPDWVESTGVMDQIQVDAETVSPGSTRTFALKVQGDSMMDAGIYDGDRVIMEARTPVDGDIVAALIDGGSTLKRFMQAQGKPAYLKAENKDYPDLLPARDLFIQGVATAVVRPL